MGQSIWVSLILFPSLFAFERDYYRDSYMDYTRRRKLQILRKRNQSLHMIRSKEPIYNDFLQDDNAILP